MLGCWVIGIRILLVTVLVSPTVFKHPFRKLSIRLADVSLQLTSRGFQSGKSLSSKFAAEKLRFKAYLSLWIILFVHCSAILVWCKVNEFLWVTIHGNSLRTGLAEDIYSLFRINRSPEKHFFCLQNIRRAEISRAVEEYFARLIFRIWSESDPWMLFVLCRFSMSGSLQCSTYWPHSSHV